MERLVTADLNDGFAIWHINDFISIKSLVSPACTLVEPLRYAKEDEIGGAVVRVCPGCGEQVRGDSEKGGWVHV